MDFSLNKILVLLLGIAALVLIVYLVRLVAQISRATVEAERFLAQLNQLSPRLDRILAETEGELADLRRVTQRVSGIALDVSAITGKAATLAVPVLDGANELTGPLKYITAAFSGARVVMQMLKKQKEEAPETSEPELQEDKG